MHGWDGVSANTLTDDDIGECLYQPQVGAGEWDPETNSFKGLIIGVKKFVDAQGNKHFMRGMFGYGPNAQGGSGSQQTLLLNSDTGQLILGDRLAARITVDPQFQRLKLNAKDNKDTEIVGALYSGNFFKEYKTDGSWMPSSYEENNEAHAGLLIDFTTPEIRFGNGNFELDTFGNLYAGGTGSIAAWKISDHSLTSKNDIKSSPSNNQSLTLLSGKRAVYWLPSVENPQPITNISSLDTTKITYDSSDAKVDEYGQPMAVLIKTTLNEGGTLKRNRTVLRKVYLDDPIHVPAIYSNNHDTIDDNNNIGFYLSQEGLSILGEYQTQDFDSNGIETLSPVQQSRIEINTTDKPTIFSGSRVAFDTKKKGFYIGEDGISLYNDKYYVRNIAADGSYEVATVDGEDYPVYLSNSGDRLICYYNEEGYANRYEFRVIDDDNNLTTTTKLPKTKSGGIYLSVDSLKMPSLYSKTSDSLTSTSDGFYLSDCGISLGSKFKVTNKGVAYIGYSAVDRGGVENGKFWTIDGNSSNSYIGYNDNTLLHQGSYVSQSVYLGTNGLRLGRTFLVDVDNNSLKIGNLNSDSRYWTLKGDSGNAYLAYNCVETYTGEDPDDHQIKTFSDLGSCVYKGEYEYPTNTAGTNKVTSLEYYIKVDSDDDDMIEAEDDPDGASPTDTGVSDPSENDETQLGDGNRVKSNTDTENPNISAYKVKNNKSVYIGTNGIRIGKHFGVNPDGEAVIKAGTIGAWTVNRSKIMSVVGVKNKEQTRKYIIDLDAQSGLRCYQLNYKNDIYEKVKNPPSDANPQALGWYEKIDGQYVLSTDTVLYVKNYYTRHEYWKKKEQWYIKPNGRAYFRKLQVKNGGENYIELIKGMAGNFTVESTGLSGGSISGTNLSFTTSEVGTATGASFTATNSSFNTDGYFNFGEKDRTSKTDTTIPTLPASNTSIMGLMANGLRVEGINSNIAHYGNNRINMVSGSTNVLHIEPGTSSSNAVAITSSGITIGGSQIYATFADFQTLEGQINTKFDNLERELRNDMAILRTDLTQRIENIEDEMDDFITKMNTALSSIRVVRADSSSETGSSANSYVKEPDSRTANATTPAQGQQHDHGVNTTNKYLKITYNRIPTT